MRLDHTVSRSFPIGVMNPSPVTATRRPFACVMRFPSVRTRGRNPPRPQVAIVRTGFGHAVQSDRVPPPLRGRWPKAGGGCWHGSAGPHLPCFVMAFADHEEQIAEGLVLQEATIAQLQAAMADGRLTAA